MTHLYVWHDSCIHVTWLMYTCDMTHPQKAKVRPNPVGRASIGHTHTHHEWHDSFIYVTFFSPLWHDLFTRVTWLIYLWDVTCNCIGHTDTHQRKHTHHMCPMTASHLWHGLLKCVTWLVFTRDVTRLEWAAMVSVIKMLIKENTHITRVPWLATWLVYTRNSSTGGRSAGEHTHHTCRVTASHVGHGSLKCVTWLVYTRDVTRLQEADVRENTG